MMELKAYKALWGMEGRLEDQIERIAAAGYYGVEGYLDSVQEKGKLRDLLTKHNLQFIAQAITNGDSTEDHIRSFQTQVAEAASFGAVMINTHGGKDSMTFDEQKRFFDAALSEEMKIGIPVGHETHRGRPLFTPWTTAALLREFPELKLTADISHWFCVCESHLRDQLENLALTADRTIHVHTRVGYPEGPQVPHPAAPEYAKELELHEEFWDQVFEKYKAKGNQTISFTPEFGPPGYMHTLPFTNHPVADLWEVCQWIRYRVEERFAAKHA
jgi:sugar phosphate isomerase/epimerase